MTKLKKLMHGALASEKRLIALCYALFFAASVLVCLASFAEDAFQRAVGNVVPAQLDVNGFALTDMQQEQPGVFTSTSPDPRMVLERGGRNLFLHPAEGPHLWPAAGPWHFYKPHL